MGLRDKLSYKHHANPSLWASFRASWAGLCYALRNERNLQTHAVVTLLVLMLSACLGLTPSEWALIVLVTGLVWCMELLNSAIEATVDLVVGEQLHPLAKIAKDVAAAAVVVAALTAIAIGGLVLGPRLWGLLVGFL